MHFKYLTEEAELSKFAEEFAHRCGNPLDINYLKSSRVRGLVKNGELCAGYVVNSKSPYRYFSWIPDEAAHLPQVSKYFSDNAVEITCIWIDHKNLNKFERNRIYLRLVLDALFSGKKWTLGGSIEPKVAQIQKRMLARVIYHGQVCLPHQPEGEVYCASRLPLAIRMAVGYPIETVRDIFRLLTRKAKKQGEVKKIKGLQDVRH